MSEWIGRDIEDMALFAQVVERGGFIAAARYTGVPQPTISRRILALESRIGASLLDRTTRRVHLTEVGRLTYDHVRIMLVEAQAARNAVDVLSATPRGLLRVAAPVLIGRSALPLVVNRFLKRYPDVSIALELTSRNLDPVEDDVDVVVRLNVPDHSQAWVDPLRLVRLGFYVAPSHPGPIPKDPSELTGQKIFGATRGPILQTLKFTRDNTETLVPISLRLRANDVAPVIQAVESCQGFALMPDYAAPQGWRSVCSEWQLPSSQIVALTTRHGRKQPRVKAFIEALKEGLI
ncbi:LysR family transcriptional regulator [Sphingorhabdus sp.]|jgi:DNA-binding transcriptional LysR family regulator|uniref:LysR family transcriptional regulator n=1 Tax=Sphingorhabdus sp. TaxID=1902408 RepID=UPI0037CBA97F